MRERIATAKPRVALNHAHAPGCVVGEQLDIQYRAAGEALSGGRGFVLHGNVDRPDRVRAALPEGFTYVHGQTVERGGVTFGFVGGGLATPIRVTPRDSRSLDTIAGTRW